MSIRENIIDAERKIIKGDFSGAAQICIKLLQHLEISARHSSSTDSTDIYAEMTLLAGVIIRLLTNASYNPSNKEVHQFLLFKRVVSQVFELSGYRSSDHLLNLIGEIDLEEKWILSASDTCRLLMGLSINAATDKIVDLLRACDPNLAFLTTIAFLSEQFTWSEPGEMVRSCLLRGDFLQDNVQLENLEYKLLASAWMGCSYATASHKHVIKDHLNVVVRNWLRSRGVEANPGVDSASKSSRPKVLIIAELYYKDHAMDRCYGADFRSLRKHFHTTLMMADKRCDPAVLDQFDEVIQTAFDLAKPEKFIKQVRKFSPDIVYFPSVGMRIGAIACANVRLAPIQIATMGHPATTRSPFVDYVVLPEDIVGDTDCFTETLLFRSEISQFIMRSDAQSIQPNIRTNPKPVRLAIPAWVRKPTPQFLVTCKEIVQKCSRPVEFWFFPNVRGVLFLAMKRRLEEMLPAKVFPSANYNKYIANINACDIHLSTFPFGATNGIVDSARQGLPIVSMEGDELHSRIDGFLAQRLDQPDWLSTSNPAEYIKTVVRLVDDDDLRTGISERILACNPDEKFITNEDYKPEDFVNIFLSVYHHHEKMQLSGKKTWNYKELIALTGTDDSVSGSRLLI